MDLGEIRRGAMFWIHLAWEREEWRALMNTEMKPRVPKDAARFLTRCTTGGPPEKGSAAWSQTLTASIKRSFFMTDCIKN
jgi:hypothetical protein